MHVHKRKIMSWICVVFHVSSLIHMCGCKLNSSLKSTSLKNKYIVMSDELNKHFLACSLCKRILKTMIYKRKTKINLFGTL